MVAVSEVEWGWHFVGKIKSMRALIDERNLYLCGLFLSQKTWVAAAKFLHFLAIQLLILNLNFHT